VVREALRDRKIKRALQLPERAALKADIGTDFMDPAEGRVRDFDADRTGLPLPVGLRAGPPRRPDLGNGNRG
jgi:hypothetical protein